MMSSSGRMERMIIGLVCQIVWPGATCAPGGGRCGSAAAGLVVGRVQNSFLLCVCKPYYWGWVLCQQVITGRLRSQSWASRHLYPSSLRGWVGVRAAYTGLGLGRCFANRLSCQHWTPSLNTLRNSCFSTLPVVL